MAGSIEGSGDQVSLNLYPMVDIFSLLIVFLLMNYSTNGESVETKASLELPKSAVKLSLDSSATVSITKSEIIVQGGITIPIVNGDIPEEQKTQGAIKAAYEEFKKIRDQNQALKNRDKALALNDADIETLVLEADKSTEFKLVKRVMLTAQQAEFISWKLAVDKEDVN